MLVVKSYCFIAVEIDDLSYKNTGADDLYPLIRDSALPDPIQNYFMITEDYFDNHLVSRWTNRWLPDTGSSWVIGLLSSGDHRNS